MRFSTGAVCLHCTHTLRRLPASSGTVWSCLWNWDGLWAHQGSDHVRSWTTNTFPLHSNSSHNCWIFRSFICHKNSLIPESIKNKIIGFQRSKLHFVLTILCRFYVWLCVPGPPAALCLRCLYSGQSLRTWPMSPHWKQRLSFSSRSSSFTSSSLSFSFFFILQTHQKIHSNIKYLVVFPFSKNKKIYSHCNVDNFMLEKRKIGSILFYFRFQ